MAAEVPTPGWYQQTEDTIEWVSAHGWPGILVVLVFLVFSVWWRWDKIRTLPGVSHVVRFFKNLISRIPPADPQKFSVLVAGIQHDEGAAHKCVQHVLERLQREAFPDLQILKLDPVIGLEGGDGAQAEAKGHERAEGYLRESGASVLVWGVLVRETPQLFFTANKARREGAQYPLQQAADGRNRLPDGYAEALFAVLGLHIAHEAAQQPANPGRYVADQLQDFEQRVRTLADGPHARHWERAVAFSIRLALGHAAFTTGEQTGENAPLEVARKDFEKALDLSPRAEQPLDWAMTQNNLGAVFATLGKRERGIERLEAAVKACRAALEVQTRKQVPLEWAMTQHNLGFALTTLGEREGSTARLEAAVLACEAALEVYTQAREQVPLDWARTQNNLGNALQALDECGGSIERLEAAVRAYKAALQERTRERVPLAWATTQNNLGNALQRLSEREGSAARLKAAVAAYEAALQERKRELVPLDWAMTQSNLGNALTTLGERESVTERLEEAVAACEAALEVFREAGASHYIAVAENNLQRARGLLDALRNDSP